ncbi:MAG: response regulator [Calothrix sp. MO_192.B10]|nr:response regulator [Calothrix sp. MO_192.B10]
MNTSEFSQAVILVVDDNPTNLKVLCGAIAAAGWEILVATDGESAIEQAEYAHPDLILLDIMMPGIDGFETCQRLKANPDTHDIPILFMTALSDTVDKVRGLSTGAVDYITKPFQTEEVLARVNVHLKLRYLSKKLERQNQELELRVQERTAELAEALENLKQSQLQTVKNEKMSSLGELVAGIAHEINNPLGLVIGNLELMNDYISDFFEHLQLYQHHYSQPTQDIIKHAKKIDVEQTIEDINDSKSSIKIGLERIAKVSNSLRTFANPDISRKEYIDIHECLDSTLIILKHRMKGNEKRADVQVRKDYEQLPYVECYPGEINQVFMNVMTNAIEAFEQFNEDCTNPGEGIEENLLTCSTGYNEDMSHITISIKDNAGGIKPELEDKIFEQFFTTKQGNGNTGLGLSITQEIVEERHQGKVKCISQLGEGTELIIELPIT